MISGYAVWGKVAAYENFQGGGGFSGSAEFLESASLKKVPPPFWIFKFRTFIGWKKEDNWLDIFSIISNGGVIPSDFHPGGDVSSVFQMGDVPSVFQGESPPIPLPVSRHCMIRGRVV